MVVQVGTNLYTCRVNRVEVLVTFGLTFCEHRNFEFFRNLANLISWLLYFYRFRFFFIYWKKMGKVAFRVKKCVTLTVTLTVTLSDTLSYYLDAIFLRIFFITFAECSNALNSSKKILLKWKISTFKITILGWYFVEKINCTSVERFSSCNFAIFFSRN